MGELKCRASVSSSQVLSCATKGLDPTNLMNCPDENQLAALGEGNLDEEILAGLSAHLRSCGDCRALIVALGSGGLALALEASLVGALASIQPMQRLGRFEIEAELGRGAMGVVHVANDPTLNRRVALKVVGGPGRFRENARERLLREARSLARLTHVNVVRIYEAGVEDDEVYIAMELIDGKPLNDWLRDKKRDWREIARVFAAAGDGLAAAHASELVHRDFKPANVMISDSEAQIPVVKVVDFGLARAALFVEEGSGEHLENPLDANRLTITGTFVGTPAYASPEQMNGLEVTPASDLFSFCVALFEALTGKCPFEGRTRQALLDAIRRGPSVSTLHQIPRPLRTIIADGLRYDVSDRPKSMNVITTALRGSLERRRGYLATGVGAVLVSAVVIVGLMSRTSDQESPCSAIASKLDGVWDAATQVAVSRSMLEAGAAPERLATVSRILGDYSRRWVSGRRSACEATMIAGEQSPELLDRRVECYRRSLRAFRAVTDILRSADSETVKTSIGLATGLPSLDECVDAERLVAGEPYPVIDPVARADAAPANARPAKCNNRLLTPSMTSPTEPSGTVLRSGIFNTSSEAWQAFDDLNGTSWLSAKDVAPAFLGYEWDDGSRRVERYTITFKNGDDLTTRAPREWTMQGRIGTTWTSLDTQVDQIGWRGSQTREYIVGSPGAYEAYRLNLVGDNDDRMPIVTVSIAQLSFFGCRE